MGKKIYKGWELLKEIAEGNIKEGTRIKTDFLDEKYYYNGNSFRNELDNECLNEALTDEEYANADFEIIEEQKEIKWKPILEYNREKYDWVLVKYFDEDYECIPDVAEMRADGKWYNRSDKEIPFEVKYFFDMQLLDKGE